MTELEVLSLKFILVMALKNIPFVLGGIIAMMFVTSIIRSQQVNKPVNDLSTIDIISRLPQDSTTEKIKKAYLLTVKAENDLKMLVAEEK